MVFRKMVRANRVTGNGALDLSIQDRPREREGRLCAYCGIGFHPKAPEYRRTPKRQARNGAQSVGHVVEAAAPASVFAWFCRGFDPLQQLCNLHCV